MASSRFQFPWSTFKNLWKDGLSSAFIPKSFGGIGLTLENTHEVAHHMRFQPNHMKQILEAHFSAQIALSLSDLQKQTKFYPVMTQFPVVAAAPTLGDVPSAHYHKSKDNKYVINGNHIVYRNADVASFYLIEAKQDDNPNNSTMFMVDKHQVGIYLEPKSDDLAVRENLRQVSFYNVTLGPEHVLCEEGDGHNVRNMMAVVVEEIMNPKPEDKIKSSNQNTYSLFL